jgi:hypothetical protein
VRIYKTYGAEAVQLISENPYRLAGGIGRIGFRKGWPIGVLRPSLPLDSSLLLSGPVERQIAGTAENHIGRSALGSASDRSCRRSLRHVLGFSFTLSTAAIHEMRVSKIVISLPYFRAPCVNVRLGNDGLGCIHLSAAQKSQPGYKGGYDASSSVTGRTGCRSRITGQCKCPSARELADVRPKPAAHV